jgi:zinc protease
MFTLNFGLLMQINVVGIVGNAIDPAIPALQITEAILLLIIAVSILYAGIKPGNIDIPFHKFVLKNGLTVLIHEDHKAPIVSVNIWYHVGSKNEKPGKTGFAHLFEHLMFNGSEHFNDDYFQAMERIGATNMNGTTNEDRTNYFQNVPSSAVDVALWMESDRMGYLLGAIDQKKLEEQRGVVQNEKRQNENEPYGMVDELITKSTWPFGHPYSWTVIGSMEDLNAASLSDVQEWFKAYYGPSNAVLVIAGDITRDSALEKVERYFGSFPAGPPIAKQDRWIAKRTGEQRQQYQDRVPQARLYKVWNVAEWGSADEVYLMLAAAILTSGKTSRLYKRLVYDDQIATQVSAFLDAREIASQFIIQATAKPGVDLALIEQAINEEMVKFLRQGPTEKELKRVKIQYVAGFVRGIERVGGFGGKSDILAQGSVFSDDPGFYKSHLATITSATKGLIKTGLRRWLSDGVYTLEVMPFPEMSVSGADADRTKIPSTAETPDARFPAIEHAVLSNGLKIVLASRHDVPLVNFRLLLDAGYASDQLAIPGVAALAMGMLDEGTTTRSALQINDELASLGAQLGSGSGLDMSFVSLNALKVNLDKSLKIFADVVLHPTFPKKDFMRLQQQQIAGIQKEKATPVQMALRVFPKLIYGDTHAYSNPLTGSGTEESVKKIGREDLIAFHKTWFKSNNATLVIVGDITLGEIVPKLKTIFSAWKKGSTHQKNVAPVEYRPKVSVYIMDKPGSQSSIIFGGHIAPPTANPDEIAIETMNEILGGAFTSRINMNLREDKHWSYGASTFFYGARGQRPFIVYSAVQTDKTKEAIQEVMMEFEGFIGNKPVTEEELAKAKSNLTLQLPGSWETIGAVAGSIGNIITYGLPDDYYTTYSGFVKKLTVDDLARTAKNVIRPNTIVWVVVGDRAVIEKELRELNYGEIGLLDGDGNIIA